MAPLGEPLEAIYERRFGQRLAYRRAVWRTLTRSHFARYIAPTATVLDLGCGYGEFINHVECSRRYAMDANRDAARHLDPEVELLCQDCSDRWELEDDSLDVVFTSNFFEHLPDKRALGRVFAEIRRCLKEGGRLIAMGPNIRYVGGRYWDFWDHHVPLTDRSLTEALEVAGLAVVESVPRFLPFTMATGPEYPSFFVRLYLRLPFLWRFLGGQFLVVAEKRAGGAG